MFDRAAITDQNDISVVENVVFSKLLEYLPNVVPYGLKTAVEYLNRSQDGKIILLSCANLQVGHGTEVLLMIYPYSRLYFAGSVTAVVLIGCKKLRMQKFVMGKGGRRMKSIALAVEQDLRKFFLNDVRVKLVLIDEERMKESDLTNRHFLNNDAVND